MAVKLRVLHGTLRRKHGGSAGLEVKVKGDRFVIGSSLDCQLRCPSSSISPHHCEILADQDQAMIRDLATEEGTFVNGERLRKPRLLQHGDVLRIGRLEFEVVMDAPSLPLSPQPHDPVGDRISQMLVDADEEARLERFKDPASRRFAQASPRPSIDSAPADSQKRLPPKKGPPLKLPTPPRVVAESSVRAAEDVLKKFFEKPRK